MLVTLLTDFGLRDDFVGVMKGVLLGINPRAQVVDLCHEIPPGDVARASWLLAWSWAYFPKGTVHVVVVDPGVGSGRKILCFEIKGHLFLVPDNGVISRVVQGLKRPPVYAVTRRRYALSAVSDTFHGRDIFAPAAGYLSKGLAPHRLGPRAAVFKRLPAPSLKVTSRGLTGRVIDIDRFGNAVTNIPGSHVRKLLRQGEFQVKVGGITLVGLQSSYSGATKGSPLSILGSRGLLEISLNRGSAASRLGLKAGDRVEVRVS